MLAFGRKVGCGNGHHDGEKDRKNQRLLHEVTSENESSRSTSSTNWTPKPNGNQM
jgi:hypothetical protein